MSAESDTHLQDRRGALASLREELVGPRRKGLPLPSHEFSSWNDSGFAWDDPATGEEIVSRNTPSFWYKVGVLFPPAPVEEPSEDDNGAVGQAEDPQKDAEAKAQEALEESTGEIAKRADDIDSEDEDVTGDSFDDALRLANERKPSSMGLSFAAAVPVGGKLVVYLPTIDPAWGWKVNGRYESFSVKIQSTRENASSANMRKWWRRVPVEMWAEFSYDQLYNGGVVDVAGTIVEGASLGSLKLEVTCRSRPHESDPAVRQMTVCLRNLSTGSGSEFCLFQVYFRVKVLDADGNLVKFSPGRDDSFMRDEESEELALIYRDSRTYAVGHGCGANWQWDDKHISVVGVSAEILPVFETTTTSPVLLVDGHPLEIDMALLGGRREGDGIAVLEDLLNRYEAWIGGQEALLIPSLGKHLPAGRRLIDRARQCAGRIRRGIELLQSSKARGGPEWKAFQLANRAMVIQQQCSKQDVRNWNQKGKPVRLEGSYTPPDEAPQSDKLGKWRPFQIAFILSALCSSGDETDPDRELVDLIWFPTGGGKTEAYLGLAAYSMFLRRLQNPKDKGTHVMMRYTLRLLTAQQFQRACALICAMESLRRSELPEIENEFSIGLWLGRDNTPNKRKDALVALREMRSATRAGANPFILEKCPWSGARIGPVAKGLLLGYDEFEKSVRFKCPDASAAPFGDNFLPIYVIDEDIFDKQPTLLIGTVDKFATLPWQPQARALFGLAADGSRQTKPPGLIIQDELHLISGPLGTMVGAYETVLEDFCTDTGVRTGASRPKIVCSTATIRRSSQQILHLFGRERSAIFPSPGINEGESFFATRDRQSDGSNAPGRMYVGVSAPALGSALTTQIRAFTALLQFPYSSIPEEQAKRRDPWWTLLIFFNSIRELGGACTLFQSDIPAWTRTWQARRLTKHKGPDIDPRRRFVRYVKELTSRLKNHEIPQAITELEKPFQSGERKTVDVCLASNIIEVGIDVPRLGLMAIVGQPKNTAQYIQVSGRVGREVGKPGLVVVLYSPTKPRDRSHYEHFRTYHERLYAQVEPTSVTPFSYPTLERALHGLIATYVRIRGNLVKGGAADKPRPVPEDLLAKLKQVIQERMRRLHCDARTVQVFEEIFERRCRQWRQWAPAKEEWVKRSGGNTPLLHPAGSSIEDEDEVQSWSTPMSMRSVDAECRLGQMVSARIESESEEKEGAPA